MEWITSLFNVLCPYCGNSIGSCQNACSSCAERMAKQEGCPPISTALDGLAIRAAFDYADWEQSLILRQKAKPHPRVVRWLAQRVLESIPIKWRSIPMVWLPGRATSGIHLVEMLAFELQTLGHPLVHKPWLSRRLRPTKPQKSLTDEQRRTRDIRQIYRTVRYRKYTGNVILLDDVITTGSTILGCKQLIEGQGATVLGAIALAYTQRLQDL
jgi:predicted amidophosphoribosyltransferase